MACESPTLLVLAAVGCSSGSTGPPLDRTSAPPAISRDRDLWLSDFEGDEDLALWRFRDGDASLSTRYSSHGLRSAHLVFHPARAPSFRLSTSDAGLADWRFYESLAFDLWNPGTDRVTTTMQIHDADGRRYSEVVAVDGERAVEVDVPLAHVASFLDLGRVTEIELFRWRPAERSSLFVDAFRLRAGSRPASDRGEVAPFVPGAEWQVGWAHSLVKVHRDPGSFRGHLEGPSEIEMARGETESFQVAVLGGSRPATVRVSVSPLRRREGPGVLVPARVEVRRVDYVETVTPYYPTTLAGGEWPDPLSPVDHGEVPPGRIQPFWVSVRAPEDQPPGTYEGFVSVTDAEGRSELLALRVNVWAFSIPSSGHLKTAFHVSPFQLEKAYESFVRGGYRWKGRLDELTSLYFEDLLRHRLSPMLHVDPLEPGFAREIERLRRLGLVAFALGHRGGSAGNNWPTGGMLDRLMPWYRGSAAALRSQGLLGSSYVYAYDEPELGLPHVAEVTAALHGADPGLRNLVALFSAPDPERHADWIEDVDILCLRNAAYDPRVADWFRHQSGGEVWIYVSSPTYPYPTLVIDYPAIAARILPWMCWKYGVDGLLYWNVNFWRRDPWARADNFVDGQNGNGALYYPAAWGPVPSLRLALLRDGMEDYEYLHALATAVSEARRDGGDAGLIRNAEELLAIDPQLVQSMRRHSQDPELLLGARRRIATAIEGLRRQEHDPGSGRHP